MLPNKLRSDHARLHVERAPHAMSGCEACRVDLLTNQE